MRKNNLPRFFGLQKQILEAAASEGYEFKLCNGLLGRLYLLNNKHVKCVAEAATQVLGDLKRYLVAAVDIEAETVFIVHFKDKDVGRILPALQDFGSPDLDLVKLMVFNGQGYQRRQRGWTALQFAIQNKVKPSTSIVVA